MKKIIQKRYDDNIKIYNSRYSKIQEEKYSLMSKYFPKYSIALDLGCGTGLLNKKLKNLIGLDISIEMLKIATYGEKVIQAQFESIPFKNNSFDAIFSFSALQSTSNLKKTMKEIKRVLKKEGTFIVTVIKRKFDPEIKKILEKNFQKVIEQDCGEDIGFICSKLY